MRQFVAERGLDQPERRIALAAGSPGVAASLDLEEYDRRRNAMMALLRAASGAASFGTWLNHSDSDKLEDDLKTLYVLLEDLLAIQQNSGEIRNTELRKEMSLLASRVSFNWIRSTVAKVDELMSLLRRNIPKSLALDALILNSKIGTA